MALFKTATKKQAKLRAALFGPSGSGKTYTALAIATGITNRTKGKMAVIDSEKGSASKYAGRVDKTSGQAFQFDTCDLEQKTIAEYIDYMAEAAKQGYDVIIIDSGSHAWQELLEEVDRLANARYKGNNWAAWREGTPKQKQFVEAILNYPGHVIFTMRSKTEWTTEKTGRDDKSKPVRVGLSPEQGKGVEYEFDFLMEITTEHYGTVIKDRTGKFQDEIIDKPGVKFGEQLIDWLNEGEVVEPSKAYDPKAPLPIPSNNLTAERPKETPKTYPKPSPEEIEKLRAMPEDIRNHIKSPGMEWSAARAVAFFKGLDWDTQLIKKELGILPEQSPQSTAADPGADESGTGEASEDIGF